MEKVTPCPNKEHMGEFACEHKEQCWEPCGELGKSEEHVKVSNVELPHEFCFMTEDGKYIAIDETSGGYPYETIRERSVAVWSTREEAEKYQSMFPKEKWILKKYFGISVSDV